MLHVAGISSILRPRLAATMERTAEKHGLMQYKNGGRGVLPG
ncbi:MULTISPECIES: hypothetical protein [Rhizobium]|nr:MULTISPECIES: hypothetical protein [Rhizobium]